MPYITASRRAQLEPALAQLKTALCSVDDSTTTPAAENKMEPGDLNYTITRLSLAFLESRGLRYENLALITGVLENVKQELYRRAAAPYEDRKIAENGDVY